MCIVSCVDSACLCRARLGLIQLTTRCWQGVRFWGRGPGNKLGKGPCWGPAAALGQARKAQPWACNAVRNGLLYWTSRTQRGVSACVWVAGCIGTGRGVTRVRLSCWATDLLRWLHAIRWANGCVAVVCQSNKVYV